METTIEIGILNFVLFGMFIMLGFSFTFIYLFNTYKKRIEREQQALRNAEINFERRMNEALFKAEQHERLQIANDLHDEMGALLTVLNMNMLTAKNQINQPENLLKLIGNTSEIIGKTTEAVRDISNRISPQALSRYGLDISIIELVNTINETNKIKIICSSNIEKKRFGLEAELNVYRIIKELINNVLKHGQTNELMLKIEYIENKLFIVFNYEGVGLNNTQVTQLLHFSKGNGLKSIQSRINNLQGNIDYEVLGNNQASILVTIPILAIEM